MPMPKPKAGESKEDFIKRFMSNETMKADYPDEKQRLAIANEQWGDKEMDKDIDDLHIYRFQIELEDKSKQWVLVFPRGTYYIEKYGNDFTFDDKFFNAIAKAFDSPTLSKPKVDEGHAFGMSYGDITDYRITDKGMEFYIELNSKGVEAVKNKEYTYISPAWGTVMDTRKNKFIKLMSVSIVNFPALEGELPQLQTVFGLSKFSLVEEKAVNTLRSKRMFTMLSKELGVLPEADEASYVAAVIALKKDFETLKADKDTSDTEKAELAKKLKTTEDQFIELSNKVKEQEMVVLEKEAKDFVEENIKLGKIHPATQDIHYNRYIANKENEIAEMELIPGNEQVSAGKVAQLTDTPIQLSEEDRENMISFAMNPDDKDEVKAFLKKKSEIVKTKDGK